MIKYEVVDFDGVWNCILLPNGSFLVDKKYESEFISKEKEYSQLLDESKAS